MGRILDNPNQHDLAKYGQYVKSYGGDPTEGGRGATYELDEEGYNADQAARNNAEEQRRNTPGELADNSLYSQIARALGMTPNQAMQWQQNYIASTGIPNFLNNSDNAGNMGRALLQAHGVDPTPYNDLFAQEAQRYEAYNQQQQDLNNRYSGWKVAPQIAKGIGFVAGALGGFAGLAGGAGLGASLGAAPSEIALGAQGLGGATGAGGLGAGGSLLSAAPLSQGATGIGGLGFKAAALPELVTTTEGAIAGAGGTGLGLTPSATQAATFGLPAGFQSGMIYGGLPVNYGSYLGSGFETGGQGFNVNAPSGSTGMYPQGTPNLPSMGGGQGLTATQTAPGGGTVSGGGGGLAAGQSFGDFLKQAKDAKSVLDQVTNTGSGGGQRGPVIQATTGTADQTSVGTTGGTTAVDTAIGLQGGTGGQSRFFGPLTTAVDEALGAQDEFYSTGSGETITTKEQPQQGGPLIRPTVEAYADGGPLGMQEVMMPAPSPQTQFTPMARAMPTDQVQMMQMQASEMTRRNPDLAAEIAQRAQASGMTPALAEQLWQISVAAIQNPQMYPQIRQFAIQSLKLSPTTLPEQFDPSTLSTLAGIAHIVAKGNVPQVPTAPVGYSGGGKIVGPGTGRSDSINGVNQSTGAPVKVSNGEYVIPADVVKTLGTKYFDTLVRKHHTMTGARG